MQARADELKNKHTHKRRTKKATCFISSIIIHILQSLCQPLRDEKKKNTYINLKINILTSEILSWLQISLRPYKQH
jgi:hypothetical protein